MTHPAARGERFLAIAGDFLSLKDIALVLKSRMGASARRVPTLQLPNWVVRLAALRDPAVKLILPELGKRKNATNEKARRLLVLVTALDRRRHRRHRREPCCGSGSSKRARRSPSSKALNPVCSEHRTGRQLYRTLQHM